MVVELYLLSGCVYHLLCLHSTGGVRGSSQGPSEGTAEGLAREVREKDGHGGPRADGRPHPRWRRAQVN